MSLAEFPPPVESLAEVVSRLGDIPLERIPAQPIGRCTEADLLRVAASEGRHYELVEGVLIEKAMGYYESLLGGYLYRRIGNFLETNPIGEAVPADGTMRLFPGLVRIPDVSFVSIERAPVRGPNEDPIPDLAPDLAVEVLSTGNTAKEMRRKLGEYFDAGVREVWLLDPRKRQVAVHRSAAEFVLLSDADTLEGGEILPGFRIEIAEWLSSAVKPSTSH